MPNNIKKILGATWYNIGFVENVSALLTQEEVDNHIHWLDRSNYKGGWFADPFIYSVSDKEIVVFVEEFVYSDNKGRLSQLIIDRHSYRLKEVLPMLDLETHLSFPSYHILDNTTYVYPENCQAGKLTIYEYDEVLRKLVNPKVLVNESLVDSQLLEINGKYYLLSTKHKSLTKTSDDLFVYESDNFYGPYKEIQVIHNNLDEERGAGRIFTLNGQHIRPAQSSVGGYGKQLIFYELTYNNAVFEEKEISRLSPCPTCMDQQLHTYNQLGNLVVVDGNEYTYKTFAKIYNNYFRSFLHKIK